MSKNYTAYQILLIIIFFQIIVGAFVSGLDAGLIYQTWPLMGETFIPNDINLNELRNITNLENHSLVQFYHRLLAYILITYIIFLAIFIFKKIENLIKPLKILLLILALQIFLGITTLISGLNIYLASAHQIMGVLLVLSAINLYYSNAK